MEWVNAKLNSEETDESLEHTTTAEDTDLEERLLPALIGAARTHPSVLLGNKKKADLRLPVVAYAILYSFFFFDAS